jgi:transposase-like protein/IS1 family transposase
MLCPKCQGECSKFGKNRNGSQRLRCEACKKTYTDESTRPVDRRCVDEKTAVLAIRMLLEGNSVRSTERLTGIHRDTIIGIMVEAGEKCERFLEKTIRKVNVDDVQADEIWGFVGCKQRTATLKGYSEEKGDAWTFVAVERFTKLVLAWHVGKRTPGDAIIFAEKLRDATEGRFQLSTDGFTPYTAVVPMAFEDGEGIDYGQLVKTYGTPSGKGSEVRYSQGQIIGIRKTVRMGNPDQDLICTSHSERANLTWRMAIRRMTRLTNGHSKKWQNHNAAFGLYFAYYNFCRVHSTIKKTPAVESGFASETWSVEKLLESV